ncbi:hypothetical protein NP493_732g00010 [Ridgeia piscesae]|uniref:CUB domain-containing protein n=1 Tax=Ridgeia piscesae TaxID=27915 RepID=A0AAD9KPP4_RIDPI|nr:hypothetical protein NP493_732g00010 [Ridgeia piscesae]
MVFVYFESDDNERRHGFEIQYSSVEGACSGKIAVLNGEKGEFGSNYDKDESCRWRIETGADQHVRLDFVNFTLPSCSDCSCDKVNVYDGRDATAPLIHTLCGSDLPGEVTSSGNELFVHFESDGADRIRRFRIRYSAVGDKIFVLLNRLRVQIEQGCLPKSHDEAPPT